MLSRAKTIIKNKFFFHYVRWKQVRMYYRWGTAGGCYMCSADAASVLTRWQHFSAWSDVMAAVLKVKAKIWLLQSMRI